MRVMQTEKVFIHMSLYIDRLDIIKGSSLFISLSLSVSLLLSVFFLVIPLLLIKSKEMEFVARDGWVRERWRERHTQRVREFIYIYNLY